MALQHITLQGPETLISQIAAIEAVEGVKLGQAFPADGYTDAADAPLGPEEVRQIIEIISITLSTATSAVVFFERVKALLAKSKQELTVKDARTGRKLGTVDEATDLAKLASEIEGK